MNNDSRDLSDLKHDEMRLTFGNAHSPKKPINYYKKGKKAHSKMRIKDSGFWPLAPNKSQKVVSRNDSKWKDKQIFKSSIEMLPGPNCVIGK